MNKYNDIIKNWQAPDGLSEDEALLKIESRLTPDLASNRGRTRTLWLSVASVAAAVVIAWMVIAPNNRVIRDVTETAAVKTITLPDGSTVTMNALSELQYQNDWDEERQVELKGEAFFEVKKGSSFKVETPHGTVTVLGTSFNVFSRGNEWRVACKTGRVSVSNGTEEVVIVPGQRVDLHDGHLALSDYNVQQRTWKEGVFYYENDQLADIIDEMERQFAIRIECSQEIRNMGGVTTNFSKDNLDAALQTVATPMGLEFVNVAPQLFRLQRAE